MYVEDSGPTQYSAASRADDLRGLPPAYLMTGGLDLFRDENIDYARRLMNAGIPVDLAVFPGAVHAFDVLAPQAAVSRRSVFHQISALKHALARKV